SPLNIIILDACRNSPFRGFSRGLGRGLARMPSVDGSLIAYSTAPGTVAIDSTGGRNSPYTAQLLKFMRQPGLTLEQVLKNTRREVKRATNGDQTPWYESSLDGYFYFSQAPVIPPLPVTARLTVRSNEYNDEVRINGKSYGSTPVEADLPLGRYHLRVTKDGFQVYESWPELRGDMKIVARLQREPIAGNSGISGAQGKRILRYIAYNNGTALDTETGLMWMRCVLGQTWDGRTCRGKGKTMDWATAKRQRLGFAGYDDWRLPTIEELRTLVYCSNGKPAYFSLGKDTGFDRKNTNFINFLDAGCTGKPNKDHKSPTVVQEVFPVHPRWILSASNANYSDYVLIMNFSNGSDNNGRNDSRLLFHVRLVRGGQ
ncbi:MAG: DUF1566 domain-containing protein, partial [Gammaproteobacteria bacterium]|nr:DUF1566 domain-containing protein [Gammaproteobacteria bacterium]